MPFIVSVTVKGIRPKGRPMEVQEIARLYVESARHLQTFIRWALGTAARPEAIIGLRSEQVECERRVVHLNPEGREQNKKHRPVVSCRRRFARAGFRRLADYRTRANTPRALRRLGWPPCVRQTRWRCRPYSLRHTAARWMRLQGVAAEEVAQQLGTGSSAAPGSTPNTTRST